MNLVGSLDNAQDQNLQFERWWGAKGDWVEEPNQRRGGESGVQLVCESQSLPVYIKRQTGHLYRTLLHPFGRPTILRERAVYQALSSVGINTPKLIYSAARKHDGEWQALLVTEALEGYVDLETWYSQWHSKDFNALLIKELAIMLARLHCSGWQHGCCYPKHIFARATVDSFGTPQVEVALLDLEKSRKRWAARKAAEKDLAQLIKHRKNVPLEDLLLLKCLHLEYLSVLS